VEPPKGRGRFGAALLRAAKSGELDKIVDQMPPPPQTPTKSGAVMDTLPTPMKSDAVMDGGFMSPVPPFEVF
jgi:hypothetical protein